MPNGMYGGVRGEETKVGQKTFVYSITYRIDKESSHMMPTIILHEYVPFFCILYPIRRNSNTLKRYFRDIKKRLV